MAVATFGNNIVGAFTGGVPVTAIYMGSTKVWPMSEPGPGDYYLEWWPKDISGSFYIGGQSRRLEDYSGYYSGPFISASVVEDGETVYHYTLDSNVFSSVNITSLSTNLQYILCDRVTEYCKSVTTINLPNCKYIGGWETFAGCIHLTSISFPVCSYIGGSYAFGTCYNLSKIYLPSCKYLGDHVFYRCNSEWLQVNLPVCSYIGNGAFEDCDYLFYVSAPRCEYIDFGAFQSCIRLSNINLPECSYISNAAFHGCYSLVDVSIPKCEYIGNTAFRGCYLISSLDLPVCSHIGSSAFKDLRYYKIPMDLILRSNSIVDIGNTIVEDYSNISIYVPSSLYDGYISRYSSFSSCFYPINN